ncbi:DUF4411 family protein [Metabacillus sp. KIGAM252]|uniref:DUF4411 family protein n=1 Tax=Metabacillus flavus TaxID=2823519 RepID=A0ABS5LAA6_9BACI|nr:DUF4411 family protein [Metabacillus flavus]MBS2967566.1 DUF4411 family protein [Metabacillus flavus]
MDLANRSIVTYMPDTNCFRYKSYIMQKIVEGEMESDEQIQRREYKEAANRFWNKIMEESNRKEAEILVSAEVVQELKVQSYTLDKKETKPILKLLEILDEETAAVPNEIEYQLREFSNYARRKFGGLIIPPGRKMDYLRASDARILIHAYLNDAILATANIKDFLLYTLFLNKKRTSYMTFY